MFRLIECVISSKCVEVGWGDGVIGFNLIYKYFFWLMMVCFKSG